MEINSHLICSVNSFASYEGLDNISLITTENHRLDPVESSDNPLNDLIKMSPCNMEEFISIDSEDTENNRTEGININAHNRDSNVEQKISETSNSISMDSRSLLLSTNMDQTPKEPYLTEVLSNKMNQNKQKSSSTHNDDDNDIQLIGVIPATPKLFFYTENKDSTIQKEDSKSIGSETLIDLTCSSNVSSPISIKSDSSLIVSSSSAVPKRKINREGSSSPILLRKKKKVNILSDTETENSFNSTENKNNSNLSSTRHISTGISDFDSMIKRKKSDKPRLKKDRDDFITSNDDLIDELINRMEEAADEDRQLNKKGQPATKKVSMFNYVASQLRKKDLQPIFLEHNILTTLREWLTPMPNGYLPCFQLRNGILRVLEDFPRIDIVSIRYSGIGRILKYLRNHPAETKENKERCNRLINEWSCPTQGHSYESKVIKKKERELLDQELYSKYSKKKNEPSSSKELNRKPKRTLDASLIRSKIDIPLRPGDSGWCPRARVPQPSVKDYINRPESKLNCEIKKKTKPNRLEMMIKKYQKQMRDKGTYRSASNLSIAGNKM